MTISRTTVTFAQAFSHQIEALEAYPYECSHCTVCDWNDACESQRLGDDHLSNVAGCVANKSRSCAKAA